MPLQLRRCTARFIVRKQIPPQNLGLGIELPLRDTHRIIAETGVYLHAPLRIERDGKETQPALERVGIAHPHGGNLPPIAVAILEYAAVACTADEAASLKRYGVVGADRKRAFGRVGLHDHVGIPNRNGARRGELQIIFIAVPHDPGPFGTGQPSETPDPIAGIDLVVDFATAEMITALAIVDMFDDGHQQPLRIGYLLESFGIDLEAPDRLLRTQTVIDEKTPVVDEKRRVGNTTHIAAVLPTSAVGIRRTDHFGRPGRTVAFEPNEIEVFAIGGHGRSHITTAVLCRITDFGGEGDILPMNQIVRHTITARIVRRKEVVTVFEKNDYGIGCRPGQCLSESAPTVIEVDGVAIGGGRNILLGTAGQRGGTEQPD